MNYSKAQLYVSKNCPKVLNDPEYVLGPNYRTILDFWWFIESLPKDRLLVSKSLFRENRNRTDEELIQTLISQTLYQRSGFSVFYASFAFHDSSLPLIGWAALELQIMEHLLERGNNLLYLPLIEKL